MEDYTKIGRIVKAHGIIGEIKIKFLYPLFDIEIFPTHFFVSRNETVLPYFITQIQALGHPDYILKLESINDRSAAETLSKLDLLLENTQVDKYFNLKESEDFGGYTLFSENGEKVGQINEVLDLPAQQTFLIIKEDQEILVPFVDNFVISIDKTKRELHYRIPDGLLDLYL